MGEESKEMVLVSNPERLSPSAATKPQDRAEVLDRKR